MELKEMRRAQENVSFTAFLILLSTLVFQLKAKK
jgi:hypothetical protein